MAKKSEAKRQAILDAALCEIEAKGFDGALVEDIAKRAGVSKGTIYSYFDNKEALLMGLAEGVFDFIQSELNADRLDPNESLPERIMKAASLGPLENNGQGRIARIFRAIWSEGLHRPELTQPLFQKLLLSILSPAGPLLKEIEASNADEFVKRYPIVIVAPMLQGILWAGLIHKMAPLDLEAYFRDWLKFIFGDFDCSVPKTTESNPYLPYPSHEKPLGSGKDH